MRCGVVFLDHLLTLAVLSATCETQQPHSNTVISPGVNLGKQAENNITDYIRSVYFTKQR